MSLTKVSYSMIDGAEFNVLDFGADPTGVADSTDAFRSAIGAYGDKRSIYVPTGTYKITGQLWLGISKTIFGDGRGATLLNYANNSANGGVFLTDAFCFIRDLAIVNVGTNTTTSIALCSWAQGGTNGSIECEFKNLRIVGFGYGVTASTQAVTNPMVATLTNAQVYDSVYDNIIFEGCGICVYLGGSGVNDTTFRQCYFLNTTGSRHVRINGAVGCSFLSCAWQSGAVGLDGEFDGSMNVTIRDNYFEPANGFYADFCPGLVIDSCVIISESFSGLSTLSFLRQTAASAVAGWTLPYSGQLSNCVFMGAVSNPSMRWATSDSPYNARTNTLNLYSKNDDLPIGIGCDIIDVVVSSSNANGYYIRHSDGTLECYVNKQLTGFGTTGAKTNTFTFPASFISAPAVSYSLIEPTTNTGRSTLDYMSSTDSLNNVIIQMNVSVAYTNAPSMSVIAIGRWK